MSKTRDLIDRARREGTPGSLLGELADELELLFLEHARIAYSDAQGSTDALAMRKIAENIVYDKEDWRELAGPLRRGIQRESSNK